MAQKALSSAYLTPLMVLTLSRTLVYSFFVLGSMLPVSEYSRCDHLLVRPKIDRLGMVVILDTIIETNQVGPITLLYQS
jgi:hypothetical protein